MRRSWTASVSAAFLCLAALGAPADWKKDYLRGKERVEEKQYHEAVPLLEKAVREKAASCQRCIKEGMFFYDYFPLYYLGQAYLATGRDAEAAECFARLEAEGTILNNKDLSGPFRMALAAVRAAAKPAAPPPTPPAAEPEPPKPSPEPAPPPSRAEPAPPPAVTPPPSKPAEPEAVRSIHRKLDAASRQLDTLDPAELRDLPRLHRHYQTMRDAIQEARGRLGPATPPRQVGELEAQASRLQAQAPRLLRTAELLRRLRGALAAVPEADLRSVPELAREADALRERARGLGQRPFDGRNDRDADGMIADLQALVADAEAFQQRAAQRLKAPPEAGTAPPPPIPGATPPAGPHPPAPAEGHPDAPTPSPVPAIREGFAAFFRGDLDAAERKARALPSGSAAHPYGHLLRGAVAWTRYVEKGSADAALRREAEEAFAAAQRAGLRAGDLPPDLFSPKLIAFFERSR
jgi:tetratricopeptide (TPR) repeat protein